MSKWIRGVIDDRAVRAMPLMAYQGLELTGLTVRDVVSSGRHQAAAVSALAVRYPHAAAVTVMDLSVEAEAFGAPTAAHGDEVPTTAGAVVRNLAEAAALPVPPVGAARTGEFLDGMTRAAAAIGDRPVLGTVIGPFSLAGRLLDVKTAVLATRRSPALVHAVLDRATAFLTGYLRAIKATGVDGVVIAEPLAGLLSPAAGEEFSFRYVGQLIATVRDDDFAAILHNCGPAARQVPAMAATSATALHLGNAVPLADVPGQLPPGTLCCGNVDPAGVLQAGTPELVREHTAALLERMRPYPTFVLSSGCDIPPRTPLANVDAFFATLAEWNIRQA